MNTYGNSYLYLNQIISFFNNVNMSDFIFLRVLRILLLIFQSLKSFELEKITKPLNLNSVEQSDRKTVLSQKYFTTDLWALDLVDKFLPHFNFQDTFHKHGKNHTFPKSMLQMYYAWLFCYIASCYALLSKSFEGYPFMVSIFLL